MITGADMKKRLFKKSERGMALVESIPVLFTLVIIFNFSLGFFGAIHSGILNSIASYNYTMETFRFRSNLVYFRPGATGDNNYSKARSRVHGIIQDGNNPNEERKVWPATIRSVAFTGNIGGEESSHKYADRNSDGIWSIDFDFIPQSSSSPSTPKIWVKTVYGICLNAECK
jgi:hypothetical protein